MLKTKIAVLVSGGGTNLQAIIDFANAGKLNHGEIALVVSNNEGAYALERAKSNGIETCVLTRKTPEEKAEFEGKLITLLEEKGIDLIILAGFMCILSENFTKKYDKRIINVHPSLIPSFCGKGYYGLKVHEEALKYGV